MWLSDPVWYQVIPDITRQHEFVKIPANQLIPWLRAIAIGHGARRWCWDVRRSWSQHTSVLPGAPWSNCLTGQIYWPTDTSVPSAAWIPPCPRLWGWGAKLRYLWARPSLKTMTRQWQSVENVQAKFYGEHAPRGEPGYAFNCEPRIYQRNDLYVCFTEII